MLEACCFRFLCRSRTKAPARRRPPIPGSRAAIGTSGAPTKGATGCHAGWLLLDLFLERGSGLPTPWPMSTVYKVMLLPPPSVVHTYWFGVGLQLPDDAVAVSLGA